MVTDCAWLRIEHCSSVDHFLAVLRPSHNLWRAKGGALFTWAHRGQADSAWKLVPRALRPGTRFGAHEGAFVSRGESDCVDQLNAEYHIVRRFVDLADDVGLHLPGDLQLLWLDGPTAEPIGRLIGTAQWPLPGVLELLAIAQHHGIPTRLLDFSYNPLVAAYFAASDGGALPPDGHLAVWAINLTVVQERCACRHDRIQIVKAPRATNPYLHAQRGLFILDRDRGGDTLDVAVHEALKRTALGADVPLVVKVEVPTACAAEILEALALEWVDRVHLMPSFDNVAAHLKQEPVQPLMPMLSNGAKQEG